MESPGSVDVELVRKLIGEGLNGIAGVQDEGNTILWCEGRSV